MPVIKDSIRHGEREADQGFALSSHPLPKSPIEVLLIGPRQEVTVHFLIDAADRVEEATLCLQDSSGNEELVARIEPKEGDHCLPGAVAESLRAKAKELSSASPLASIQSMLQLAEEGGLTPKLTFPPLNEQRRPDYFQMTFEDKNDPISVQPEPPNRIDHLTGIPTASTLSSEAGYNLIEQEVGLMNRPAPQKIVVFLDFNNMGAADRVMRQAVNDFLKEFSGYFQQACRTSGIRGLALRLGGDEFLLILPDAPASLVALREFFEKINAERRKIFADDSPTAEDREGLIKAEQFAWLRTQLKMLRKELSGSGNFDLARYRRALLSALELPAGDDTRHNAAELAMQLALARNNGTPGRQPIMTITAAPPVKVARARCTGDWREGILNFRQAIATGKAAIGGSKLLAPGSVQEVIECNPCMKIRQAELASMEAGSNIELKLDKIAFRTLKNADSLRPLTELLAIQRERLLATDPGINDGTLRYDRAKAKTLGQYLPLQSAAEAFAVNFDIRHFGVLNNQIGYERADELIAVAARIIRKHLPGAVIVRANGGSLIALTLSRPSLQSLRSIRREMNLPLRLFSNDPVRAEVEERLALGRWRDSKTSAGIEPPPVRLKNYPHAAVKARRLKVSPSTTLEEALVELVQRRN